MTSALIDASRPSQIQNLVGATANTAFSAEELAEIDRMTAGLDVNIWN